MKEQEILSIWDQCANANYLHRGIALSSLVAPKTDWEELSKWSVEKRDVALFSLRNLLFGSEFSNVANCPCCNETVEWNMDYHSLNVPVLSAVPNNIEFQINLGEAQHTVRLPQANDLVLDSESQIITRCINSGEEIENQTLIQEIKKRFDELCVFSNLSFELQCVSCTEKWEVLFDILSYLWSEVDSWAKKFLQQVVLLAKELGWSEKEILALSPHRRNQYLELLYL